MTMIPFIGKGYKAKECLELVHTNVCGPFNVYAWEKYEYFITFMDDYPKFGYVYLMHRKFDAYDKFIEFKAGLENQLGKHIKTLQSDRGSEYLSSHFHSFLKKHEILSQWVAA